MVIGDFQTGVYATIDKRFSAKNEWKHRGNGKEKHLDERSEGWRSGRRIVGS
jgi:hypothetical protein